MDNRPSPPRQPNRRLDGIAQGIILSAAVEGVTLAIIASAFFFSHGDFWPGSIIAFAIVALCAYRGWRKIEKRHDKWLALRGHCPVCGYDLRCTPTRCPECGIVIHNETTTHL